MNNWHVIGAVVLATLFLIGLAYIVHTPASGVGCIEPTVDTSNITVDQSNCVVIIHKAYNEEAL